jgi:hypothetical protein
MLAQADAEFPELKITDVETTKEKIIKENLSSLLREYVLNVKQVN